jgi:hypothetical protein
MTSIAQQYIEPAWPFDAQQRVIHHPLLALLLLFALLTVGALADLAYLTVVSWPNWTDASDAPDTPSIPIVVAGVSFRIQPAAIRWAMQRQPGMQSRVDLIYLWPSLEPPHAAARPTVIAPANPDQLLFVTIQSSDDTLPMMERMQKVYPRYLAGEPTAGPNKDLIRTWTFGQHMLVSARDPPKERPTLWTSARHYIAPTNSDKYYEEAIGM